MTDITAQNGASIGAEALTLRSTSIIAEVHGYVSDELTSLEVKIKKLKEAVEIQRHRAQQETELFIQLANEASQASAIISKHVDKLANVLSV